MRRFLILHAIAATRARPDAAAAPDADDGAARAPPPAPPLAPRTDYAGRTARRPRRAGLRPVVTIRGTAPTSSRRRWCPWRTGTPARARRDHRGRRRRRRTGRTCATSRTRAPARRQAQRLSCARHGRACSYVGRRHYFAPNRLRASAELMRGGDVCFLGADAAYRFDVGW